MLQPITIRLKANGASEAQQGSSGTLDDIETRRAQMGNLVHNERMKLAATFFNNVGVATLAVGTVLPLVSGSVVEVHPPLTTFVEGHGPLTFFVGFVGAMLFMGVGQFWLRDLRE
jgi:hypothetical protein